MRSRRLLARTLFSLLLASTLAACERDSEPMVADPPEPSEQTPEQPQAAPEKPEEKDDSEVEPRPSPSPPKKAPDPLAKALEAPDGAITSEGRFEALMERGLAEYMPEIGLLYGAAGVDEPGLRVAVAADGRGRWARGDGPFWGDLADSGNFELSDEDAAQLAELVAESWTSEVDYPASSVKQTRVIIVRDGETVRVFEHSSVPAALEPVEALVRKHVPDEAD
ncbi:MAG: hypothetical protein ACQEVA_14360 [Myxococcota bacterium]